MKQTFLIILILTAGCYNKQPVTQKEMIGGFIFDGPSKPPITRDMISKMKDFNANWIATTPEAFTYHQDLSIQTFYDSGNWFSETLKGSIVTSKLAKELGMKIMLKPHLSFLHNMTQWNKPEVDYNDKEQLKNYLEKRKKYINSLPKKTKGNWRGDFEVADESEWPVWEKQYSEFILDCALIADSLDLEMFCIGTELSISATKREVYWRNLIKQVRGVYTGPLTFSANWDNYRNIKFWDELDYIGISAYFPLSDGEDPSNSEIEKNWQTYFSEIQRLSMEFRKPVLFTEYGYPSGPSAAQKPWSDTKNDSKFDRLQYKLYKELYKKFWGEQWFAGGFIWKWKFTNTGESTAYSPQGKNATELIKKWYAPQ